MKQRKNFIDKLEKTQNRRYKRFVRKLSRYLICNGLNINFVEVLTSNNLTPADISFLGYDIILENNKSELKDYLFKFANENNLYCTISCGSVSWTSTLCFSGQPIGSPTQHECTIIKSVLFSKNSIGITTNKTETQTEIK